MVERSISSGGPEAAFARLRALWKRLYDELPPPDARDDVFAHIREDLDTIRSAARFSEEAQPMVELALLVRMDAWRPGEHEGPSADESPAPTRRPKAKAKPSKSLPDGGRPAERTSKRSRTPTPSGDGPSPSEKDLTDQGERAESMDGDGAPGVDELIEDAADGVRAGLEMRLRTLRQMEAGDDILAESGRALRTAAARDLVFFERISELVRAEDDLDEAEAHRLIQSFDPRRKLVREEVQAPNAAVEAIEFLVRLGAG